MDIGRQTPQIRISKMSLWGCREWRFISDAAMHLIKRHLLRKVPIAIKV